MTDKTAEQKNIPEVKKEIVPEVKAEVKAEIKAEVKLESKSEVKQSQLLPFITEQDIFDISIKYYIDGKKYSVELVDDTFDKNHKDMQELVCKLKYPSQGDISMINSKITGMKLDYEGLDIRDFAQIEFIRFLVLVRKWNLEAALNNENVMKLHPNIVKAVILKVREEIGLEAII